MRLGTIRTALAGAWQQIVLHAALLVAAAGLLWFKLGSLTGGYSAGELQAAQHSLSWQYIFHHPLNAPFAAAIHALTYIVHDHLLAARMVAAACGLGALILFYTLARLWYGQRTALWGVVLFGTSAWFLHTARLGTPDALLFGVLALAAWYAWLKHTESGVALLVGFILVAALLYVPGMIWFIVIGLIIQWRAIDHYFKRSLWAVTAGGLLLIAALVPLGLAIYHSPEVAKVYAGLPAAGWPAPLNVLHNLVHVPENLFVLGSQNPEHWLGRLAIIDFFTSAMFFLGGYLYVRHIKLKRFWVVVGALVVGTVLIGLGGGVTITVLVPFIYMVAAAGVGFMLDRWLTVFPRNVIAQTVGYGLLSAAVLATCTYSLRHYYIAWPHTPATKTIFTVPASAASVTMKR